MKRSRKKMKAVRALRQHKARRMAEEFGSVADRLMPLLNESMYLVRKHGDRPEAQRCAAAIQAAIGWATDLENAARVEIKELR